MEIFTAAGLRGVRESTIWSLTARNQTYRLDRSTNLPVQQYRFLLVTLPSLLETSCLAPRYLCMYICQL